MRSIRTRGIGQIAIVGLILMLAGGCASSHITFRGPPGTVMTVDSKPYHLPADIELSRPNGSGGSTRHDVSVVATVQSRELRAKGHIDMFGYSESDVDKMAVNTCILDETELANIFDGKVVVYKGQTASRQPLYELTLGKE